MHFMKKLFFSFLALALSASTNLVQAIDPSDIGNIHPNGQILQSNLSLIDLLSLAQEILLKVVLPLIIVWTALYIAYQLITADGDETRMKQAWRSIAYSSIALVTVALSYALVSIFASISLP